MVTFLKTDAIALRVSPFSRTSHVVTWLTRDAGRIVTVVKGAQRKRSPFLGAYDVFRTCEIVYYARDRGGAHILKECSPAMEHERLRTDIAASAVCSYACDLLLRNTPEGPMEGMFAVLSALVAAAGAGCETTRLLLWFDLKFLSLSGFEPQLARCVRCGRGSCRAEVSGDGAFTQRLQTFSPALGGVLCEACCPPSRPSAHMDRAHADDAVRVPAAAISRLRDAQRTRAARDAESMPADGMPAAVDLCGKFLQAHLAAPDMTARRVAMGLMAQGLHPGNHS